MSAKRAGDASNLFAAAGLEQDAPRPLPDRYGRERSPMSSVRIIFWGPTAR